MAFIDPIELMQLTPPLPDTLSDADVQRGKRKLQAEFELAGRTTIPHHATEIDQSSAMKALEQLADPAQREHYLRLHGHRDLLDFLHGPTLLQLARIPADKDLGSPAFNDFVATRLAPAYRDLIERLTRQNDWIRLRLALNLLVLLEGWDHEQVLEPFATRIYLLFDTMAALRQNNAADWSQHWDPTLIDEALLDVINALPPKFDEIRKEFAKGMMRAGSTGFRQQDSRLQAFELVRAAMSLRLPATIAMSVRGLRDAMWQDMVTQKDPNVEVLLRKDLDHALTGAIADHTARKQRRLQLLKKWAPYLLGGLVAAALVTGYLLTRKPAEGPPVPNHSTNELQVPNP
jgi:hypothetical protein